MNETIKDLNEILESLKESIKINQIKLLEEVLSANEFGVFLEMVRDFISEEEIRIKNKDFLSIKKNAEKMNLDGSIYKDIQEYIFD